MTGVSFHREEHWDHIYETQSPEQLSWYQAYPALSMDLIRRYGKRGTRARMIDIGGGCSNLVEVLLDNGYRNVTVLDISSAAIEKTRERLHKRADHVQWIHTDVLDFTSLERFDIWHDRAAFHFLLKQEEIAQYIRIAEDSIQPGGLLILATFSETGPRSCSRLPVQQYSGGDLEDLLHRAFRKRECLQSDHFTPRGTAQSFTFCVFERRTLQN